ncbi:MAG TPA: lipid-A-disaccharide synthase [Candidatus Binataceae bacterium]|nr:lipid-A-disaccharide synthase [Candidatus Binataceae bacterium]
MSSANAGAHPRRRVLIVAGEASGDLHGADLAREMLARDPRWELSGIAGARMREAGVTALFKAEDIAGLGIAELASTIRLTLGALRDLRRRLRSEPPDLLILIDFAEFNMILAGVAHRAGVPVLYYITPQVWAWRRGRIGKLMRRADRLAVVFPFEAELFAGAGERVTFVGHPLLDRVKPEQDRAATLARHGFRPRTKLLALMPGSRHGEIHYLLRPMLAAAKVLAGDHDLTPVIVLAPTLRVADLREVAGSALDGVHIITEDAYSIIASSQLALVASGTATLETALLGCPMVIAYKMSPLTYALGRLLIKGVDFIGMPNLLAGRRIVPELIQWEVTPAKLVRAGEPMLAESLHAEVATSLKAVAQSLGTPGAAGRVADIALGMLSS